MDIHEWIKTRRTELGMSMETLARLVGVKSWQTIQQWEKPNGTAPKRTRWAQVVAVLGEPPKEVEIFSIPARGQGTDATNWPFPFSRKRFDQLPKDRQRQIADFGMWVISEWEAAHRRKEQA